MILHIADRDNRVLGLADITGTRWISAHDGFINEAAITIKAVLTGQPIKGWMTDDLGHVRTRIDLGIVNPHMYRGSTVAFRAGDLVITIAAEDEQEPVPVVILSAS